MSQYLKNTFLVIAATFLLCFLAFYNGFPLLYSDTGTYIHSGFTGNLPIDRPIFYGLFVRHISLASSPWLVILAQAAMVAWLLLLTLRRFVPNSRLAFYYVPTLLILVLTTAISYFTDLLIPDIFTPILFLSGYHLMLWHQLKWSERIPVVAFFVLALSTHLSNFPTIVLTLLGCLVIFWIRRKQQQVPFKRRSLILVAVLVTTIYLLVPTYNASQDGHFRYAPGASIFMANRLRDLDILKNFLEEDCPQGNWKLCPYKGDLYGDFLWDINQSALYKTGGWEANFDEYKRMNRAIFSRPRFLARFLRASFEDGLRQLFVFHAGPALPYPEESSAIQHIKTHFNSSLRGVLGSRQIHGQLDLEPLNRRQEWVVLLSLGFLLILTLDRRRFLRLPADLRWLYTALTLFTVANSFTCATLAMIDARYQGRLIWLFPFVAMLILMVWAEQNHLPSRFRRWVKGNAM